MYLYNIPCAYLRYITYFDCSSSTSVPSQQVQGENTFGGGGSTTYR